MIPRLSVQLRPYKEFTKNRYPMKIKLDNIAERKHNIRPLKPSIYTPLGPSDLIFVNVWISIPGVEQQMVAFSDLYLLT